MEVVVQGEVWIDDRPYLRVLLDGEETLIFYEQKRIRDGLVYLGIDWEDRIEVELPADPANNRGPATLAGVSDDPDLVGAVQEWLEIDETPE